MIRTAIGNLMIILYIQAKGVVAVLFKRDESKLLDQLNNAFQYEDESELPDHLLDAENKIGQIFSNCSDLRCKKITIFHSKPLLLVYISVLVDDTKLDTELLAGLLTIQEDHYDSTSQLIERLERELLPLAQVKVIHNMKEVVSRITQGEVVVFIESSKQALSINMKNKLHRDFKEPNIESLTIGPRIGFIEVLDINLGLIRKHLRTPRLKVERMTVGNISQTPLVIAYIEGMAATNVVQQVKQRISQIKIDSVMDTGYIMELIRDKSYSPFPLIEITERPDTTAASLVEGKVMVMVDGSPLAIIAPVNFWYGFQSIEDYYMHFIFATQLRWLRFLFSFIALTLPSLYVAITTYHQEMIPTGLALTLAASREVVPFPAVFETLIMEIIFDVLREAGVRLPRSAGQTVSIVGALVIGQSAVQAGIISAPIVMVVSLTGVASFIIPRPTMAQAITLLRFPLLMMAGMFGLYGVGISLIALIIHLANLRSFGMFYLRPLAPLQLSGLLDVLVRAPWKVMQKRQQYIRDKMELE